ncbi:Uncharacterized protein PCOAH_00008950 [Plasmodium coatneyi]|uniref:UDP-N-acetylglucosamine transferase subunit ALG14 n=1 Tax=Plasmodium coatneyi TaxID=208452 RepID=A0A1B1DV28_9APIC|nr:Uncharacterized protein PCOAH_00008950 [Plasmodium coatneyi]ANQ06467.1 Uncharacterized protein PCOAH_00008950 [Plasmodium coatneyi]
MLPAVACLNAFFFVWLIFTLLKNKLSYNTSERQNGPVEIGVVLGSGGHTFEMLQILELIKDGNISFHFFYANNDLLSREKAENALKEYKKDFFAIPRCRNVGESYIRSSKRYKKAKYYGYLF